MALIVAFVVTVAVTPGFGRLAKRLDVVDHPGPLKVQTRPVPYLGGLAVLAGVAGPVAWSRPVLLVPLGLAALLGLADDVSELGSWFRLACELAIGVVVAVTANLAWPVVPIGAVIALVLINAVNLLDGLDGLASGTALVSAAGFAVILSGDFRVLAVSLAAALAGFLVWNRPPARIYLGDSGSYLIGTALAVLTASTIGTSGSVPIAAAAALLVGVPVGDTAIAIVRRWRAHRPLFAGDRGHVYDQLADRQWSRAQATLACVAAQLALAIIAVGIAQLSGGTAAACALVIVAAVAAWAIPAFTSPAPPAR